MDLHQPDRPLHSLSPYEHLERILRICIVHLLRRIRSCSVPDPIRHKMRSLACLTHPNWDATLADIKEQGGKAAIGEIH